MRIVVDTSTIIAVVADEAEKARDYLLKLPERMYRITERIVVPKTDFQFKWMNPLV